MLAVRALLFSGGVESTCLAYAHRPDLLITIDYGQVCAAGEIRAAKHLAAMMGLPQRLVTAPLGHLGSGQMSGAAINVDDPVPEHWPFRNQMLATIAVMACAEECLTELMIGTVSTDHVHADGSQAFVDAMNNLLESQRPSLTFSAPAIDMDTQALVRSTKLPRELLGWTFSCHSASVACGQCRGCAKTIQLVEALDSKAVAAN